MYHITWSHGGNASTIVESIKKRLSVYPADCEKILVFDNYEGLSSKDHERMRRAFESSTTCNLTINSPLPNLDSIMKNKQSIVDIKQRAVSAVQQVADVIVENCLALFTASVVAQKLVLTHFCPKILMKVITIRRMLIVFNLKV